MHNKKLLNRKGAIELSVGTIVVIVLAMSMLILGLVLIKNIFRGSIDNFNALNRNVEGEINKLFNEGNDRLIVYLPDGQLDIKKGRVFGVGFGVRNNIEGESSIGNFAYKVQASSIQKNCKLTLDQANNYLKLGDSGTFNLSPGQINTKLRVDVQITESAPLCLIRYDIIVTEDGEPYTSGFFNLNIKG